MTCIVGLVADDQVWMGGDSAGAYWYDVFSRTDTKVWKKDRWIFGFCGSFRMGQLLRYSLQIPRQKEDQTLEEFMVVDFINAVRSCYKDGGFMRIDKHREEGGSFLVGHQGRLFCVEDDFQVAELRQNYMAIGCGESYALGSLFMTENRKPQYRIEKALEAACYFSGGVLDPFVIERLD